jgi:hypothetical protein
MFTTILYKDHGAGGGPDAVGEGAGDGARSLACVFGAERTGLVGGAGDDERAGDGEDLIHR